MSLKSIQNEIRVEKRGFRDKIKERDKISCKIKKKEERDSNGL